MNIVGTHKVSKSEKMQYCSFLEIMAPVESIVLHKDIIAASQDTNRPATKTRSDTHRLPLHEVCLPTSWCCILSTAV